MKDDVDEIIANSDFHEAVKIVKEGIKCNAWLRSAFLSWYRKENVVSLYGSNSLDDINIEVLRLILNLRRFDEWRDLDLYELELFAKKFN